MRKVISMRRLRSHIFCDNETIDTFFCTMRELRKEAIDMGNEIPDSVFREIVLAAFPTASFDTIMQNINANPSTFPSSSSVIQHISFQYSRSENRPDAVVPGDRLPQANSVAYLTSHIETLEKQLAASANAVKSPEKKCRNCQRQGHLIEDCFRKGGGKEGQYPPWWKGKKDTTVGSSTANVTATPPESTPEVGELPQYFGLTASLIAENGNEIYTPCDHVAQSSEASTPLRERASCPRCVL
ncbi:hypothetical protein F5878DRAFT_624395 [Lentinula raphanica]|uniref:CCHC-type domain-containing protein n=1 Tax=Lentinula raphanica TaxID=153919 RepID=A0AA38UBV6_9AGAR|nr:hypothetical protein F5878DRAFT_624395 [Lentinula raphanica]